MTPAAQLKPQSDGRMDEELRKVLGTLTVSLQENTLQLARLDERQRHTSEKVDALVLNFANNSVSIMDFGILKQRFDDHKVDIAKAEASMRLENQRLWLKVEEMEKDRQSDRTWFIRLTLGGAFSAFIAAFGLYWQLKGGGP